MKLAAISAFALLLGACARPIAPFVERDPADPTAAAPPTSYRSPLTTYQSRRPIEPGEWKSINERIAPKPKSEQGGDQ